MSTASLTCRVRLQRLQDFRFNAPGFSGGLMVGPWALRPKRLQWPANMSGKQTVLPSPETPVPGLARGPGLAGFRGRQWTPCDLVLCKFRHFAQKAASLSGFPLRFCVVLRPIFHFKSVTPAKAGVQLRSGRKSPKLDASLRWHDGGRNGASGFKAKQCHRRASAFFFHKILIGHEARAGTSPPLFFITYPRAPP